MKRLITKRAAVITVFTIMLALLIAGFMLPQRPVKRKENGIRQLQFSVGDTLTGYDVAAYDGAQCDVADIIKQPSLIIFGMKGCKDCIADFPSYKILYGLYHREDYEILFIWDDEIPQEELMRLDIPEDASYSAQGNYKFTDWVPSYFLVDENGVVLNTTTELSELGNFLPDITVSPKEFESFFEGKQILLGIDRCGSCKSAFEKLESNSVDFLYYVEGENNGEENGIDKIYDPAKLLSRAFSVEEFPALIYMDEEGVLRIDYDD